MDYTKNLVTSMNNVSLENEEGGVLALENEELVGNDQLFSGFDAKLYVVARFIGGTCGFSRYAANISGPLETRDGGIYQGFRNQSVSLSVLSRG